MKRTNTKKRINEVYASDNAKKVKRRITIGVNPVFNDEPKTAQTEEGEIDVAKIRSARRSSVLHKQISVEQPKTVAERSQSIYDQFLNPNEDLKVQPTDDSELALKKKVSMGLMRNVSMKAQQMAEADQTELLPNEEQIDSDSDTDSEDQPMLDRDAIIKDLRKETDAFQQRHNFEKGEYHQCIPNPAKANGFITVQLVQRTTQICQHRPDAENDEDIPHFCEDNRFKRYKFHYDHGGDRNEPKPRNKTKSKRKQKPKRLQSAAHSRFLNKRSNLFEDKSSSSSISTQTVESPQKSSELSSGKHTKERPMVPDIQNLMNPRDNARNNSLQRQQVKLTKTVATSLSQMFKRKKEPAVVIQERSEKSNSSSKSNPIPKTQVPEPDIAQVQSSDEISLRLDVDEEVGGLVLSASSKRSATPKQRKSSYRSGTLQQEIRQPLSVKNSGEMLSSLLDDIEATELDKQPSIDELGVPSGSPQLGLNKLISTGLPEIRGVEYTKSKSNYGNVLKKHDDFVQTYLKKLDKVDSRKGVEHHTFASLQQRKTVMMGRAGQIAVVAYWRHDFNTNTFECDDFFYLPYPMIRRRGANKRKDLLQFLYTGKNGDVFCFFDDTYAEKVPNQDHFTRMSVCVLDLKANKESVMEKNKGDASALYQPKFWGQVSQIPGNSQLAHYIYEMNSEKFHLQRQLPNIDMMDLKTESGIISKHVIFSSYMQPRIEGQNHHQRSLMSRIKSVARTEVYKKSLFRSENHYPSLFFYNIEECRVDWTIYGGWIYLDIDKDQNVWFMTSTHINSMQWMTEASPSDKANLDTKKAPPEQQRELSYVIDDQHCPIKHDDSAEVSKVLEAILHPNKKRVTLAFHNFGTFTYQLRNEAKLDSAPHNWHGDMNQRLFGCALTLKAPKAITEGSDEYTESIGEGEDIDGAKFKLSLKIQYGRYSEYGWLGHTKVANEDEELLDFKDMRIQGENAEHLTTESDPDHPSSSIDSEALKQSIFSNISLDVKCEGTDKEHGEFNIHGTVVMPDGDVNHTQMNHRIEFQQRFTENPEYTITYDGLINTDLTEIRGTFETSEGRAGSFQLKQEISYPALIKKTYKEHVWKTTDEIEGNYLEKDKKFETLQDESHKIVMSTKAHVKNAHLIYYIDIPDARIVQSRLGNPKAELQPYVQGKLSNQSSRPDGYTNAEINLYHINEKAGDMTYEQIRDTDNNLRNLIGCEPSHSIFDFLLPKAIEQSMNKSDSLIRIMPIMIDDKYLTGAVIYENLDTCMMNISFLTSDVEIGDDNKLVSGQTDHYSQDPLGQPWTLQYPILAYKSFTPDDEELVILNLAVDMPHRYISLDGWEFICFVEHAEKADIKIYNQTEQRTIDIMFLARRDDCIRLMSYKTDPWNYTKDPEGKVDKGIYIPTQSQIILFSGVVIWPNREADNTIGKRIKKEKIKCCHLLTQYRSNQHQFAIVLQFMDRICLTWLKDKPSSNADKPKDFQVISHQDQMAKLKMVRGTGEKLFFVENTAFGSSDKIMMLEFNENENFQIQTKEVYTNLNSKIILFSLDQDSITSEKSQAFSIVDDELQIKGITNGLDGELTNFEVDYETKITNPDLQRNLRNLTKNNWTSMCMNKRALTFNDRTYSLNSELAYKISEEDMIQDSQSMNNTSNMIAITINKQNNCSFIVKPSPGRRRKDLICSSMFGEVSQMAFISNRHVLMHFKQGSSLSLEVSGKVITQSKQVSSILDNARYKMISHTLIDPKLYRKQKTMSSSVKSDRQDQAGCRKKDSSRLFIFELEAPKKSHEPHVNFKVICFRSNGKGDTIHESLEHQIGHKRMQEDQFIQEKRDSGIKLDVKKMMASSKMYFRELRFRKDQTLVSIAIFIRNEIVDHDYKSTAPPHLQSEMLSSLRGEKPAVKVQKKNSMKLHIRQSDGGDEFNREQNVKSLLVNLQVNSHDEYQLLTKAKFVLVGKFLAIKMKSEQIVRVLDLEGSAGDDLIDHVEYRQINIESMQYNSEKDALVMLRELPEGHLKIIKAKHGQSKKTGIRNVLQISIGNNAKMFELDGPQPQEISYLEGLDRFGGNGELPNTTQHEFNPEGFINTGYIQTHLDPHSGSRLMIMGNEMSDFYIKRSHVRNSDTNSVMLVWDQVSIYRTFSEIDLHEIEYFHNLIQASEEKGQGRAEQTNIQEMRDLDRHTLQCIFNGQTVFSMFFKADPVYNQIHKQLEELFAEINVEHLTTEEQQLYAARLLAVLQFPVEDLKILGDDENEPTRLDRCLGKVPACLRLYRFCLRTPEESLKRGYKSILKKSVHQRNTQWLDYLMQFTDYAQDNSIESFVESLVELKILFEMLSPTVAKYFESCFIKTNNSISIKRVQWQDDWGSKQRVVNNTSSHITVGEITDRTEEMSFWNPSTWFVKDLGTTGKKTYYKNVAVTLLRTDWIYNQGTSMDDLIIAMSNANDELFKTDLFNVLIGGFWKTYVKTVVMLGFVPWLIYTILSLFYLSNFLNPETNDYSPWVENSLSTVVFVLNLYFLAVECYQCYKQRILYFCSLTNLFQLCKIFLVQTIITSYSFGFDYLHMDHIRNQAVFCVFVLYFDIFYWFKIIEKYAMVVRVLENTIRSVLIFMSLLFLVVLMFSNITYLIDQNRQAAGQTLLNQNEALFGDKVDGESESRISAFEEAFITQYLISLGTFTTTSFVGEQEGIIWIIFIFATFILQIVFLNMLIALMSLTFDNTITATHQASKEKVGIMADWSWINVTLNMTEVSYMFSVKPLDDEDDNDNEEYVSRIKQIKRELRKSQNKVMDAVNRQGMRILNAQKDLEKKMERDAGLKKNQNLLAVMASQQMRDGQDMHQFLNQTKVLRKETTKTFKD